MFKEISEKVRQDLVLSTSLLALLTNGADSIRPLIAELEDGSSFVVYHVRFDALASKDALELWEVVIQCWSLDYDRCISIADEVCESLKGQYNLQVGGPKFSEQNQIYTELIFNTLKT